MTYRKTWKSVGQRGHPLRGRQQSTTKKKDTPRGETKRCQADISPHTQRFGTRIYHSRAARKVTRCRRRGIYHKKDRSYLCQQHRIALHGREVFEREFQDIKRDWAPRRPSTRKALAEGEWAKRKSQENTRENSLKKGVNPALLPREMPQELTWEMLVDMC